MCYKDKILFHLMQLHLICLDLSPGNLITLRGEATSALNKESNVIVTFPGMDSGSEIFSLLIVARASGPEQEDHKNSFNLKFCK